MSREALWDTVKKYRRWIAVCVATILILALSISVYYVQSNNDLDVPSKVMWLAILAVLGNLAATVIAFTVTSKLFSSVDAEERDAAVGRIVAAAISAPKDLSQVPWVDFIDSAAEIDFVVQGWNGWGNHAGIGRAIEAFFERGGKFRLYVCNPESPGAEILRQFMEQRLNRSSSAIIEEIRGTYRTIDESRPTSKRNSSRLDLIQTDRLNWYFAASFKGRVIPGQVRARDVMIFSIYSHTPMKPWDMPAIVIYPDMHRTLSSWFNSELKHLREGDPNLATSEPKQPSGEEKTI